MNYTIKINDKKLLNMSEVCEELNFLEHRNDICRNTVLDNAISVANKINPVVIKKYHYDLQISEFIICFAGNREYTMFSYVLENKNNLITLGYIIDRRITSA